MSRRWTKTFQWLAMIATTTCGTLAPNWAVAQTPSLQESPAGCPLGEDSLAMNQCSDYLYQSYQDPGYEAQTGGATHDSAPLRTASPLPAVSDSLPGHDPFYYGCGDYDGIRISRAASPDYWGERSTAAHDWVQPSEPWKDNDRVGRASAPSKMDDLAVAENRLAELYEPVEAIDLAGTCYEQTLVCEQYRTERPAHSAARNLNAIKADLVERTLKITQKFYEEYTPYDLIAPAPKVVQRDEYWDVYKGRNYDATMGALDNAEGIELAEAQSAQHDPYWDAYKGRNYDATMGALDNAEVIDLTQLRHLPALANVYSDWIQTHPYVQNPKLLQQDLYSEVEMKLCGSPAYEVWMKHAYAPAKVARPAESLSTKRLAGWLAQAMESAGKQMQQASARIALWAEDDSQAGTRADRWR